MLISRQLASKSLLLTNARAFSIVAPNAKLHFIDHPRYGSVYPIVCLNDKQLYFRLTKAACVGSSLLNFSLLYSLFVSPLFTPALSAIMCHPAFILPSFIVNYGLFARYYPYFYLARSHVVNMFLRPNGKQVIVETRDGESKIVNNMDFFDVKTIQSKF